MHTKDKRNHLGRGMGLLYLFLLIQSFSHKPYLKLNGSPIQSQYLQPQLKQTKIKCTKLEFQRPYGPLEILAPAGALLASLTKLFAPLLFDYLVVFTFNIGRFCSLHCSISTKQEMELLSCDLTSCFLCQSFTDLQ